MSLYPPILSTSVWNNIYPETTSNIPSPKKIGTYFFGQFNITCYQSIIWAQKIGDNIFSTW